MHFSLRSVGHFFSILAHDVKVGATFLAAHEQQIDAGLRTGATLVGVADPALAPIAIAIERAGEAMLGEALGVVAKLSDAEAVHGANVVLDTEAIQALKDLLKHIEQLKPGSTIAPASLPATPKAA